LENSCKQFLFVNGFQLSPDIPWLLSLLPKGTPQKCSIASETERRRLLGFASEKEIVDQPSEASMTSASLLAEYTSRTQHLAQPEACFLLFSLHAPGLHQLFCMFRNGNIFDEC